MKYSFIEEIIDNAFKKAKNNTVKIHNVKEKNITKIQIVYQYVDSKLEKIYNSINIPEDKFYWELYKLIFPNIKLKRLKERIKYIRRILKSIYKNYKDHIKSAKEDKDIDKYRRQFYGRVTSILRRNWKIFKNYNIYLKEKKKIPNIKNYPTVVIAGLPNVGKSTLLKKLTGSNVKIEQYPFTTKDLMIGYIYTPYFNIQVIDTPGILDRPIEYMNEIEKKAILALDYLANIVIYIIDITETCGYSIKEQLDMFENIRKIFKKDIILYFSKSDIFKEEDIEKLEKIIIKYNIKYFNDHNLLKDYLIEYIKNKSELYI